MAIGTPNGGTSSPAIPLEKTLRDLLDYWRQKTKESSSINI